jgi:hypothetical protein
MEGLKALIIENEYEIPGEIKGFLKDNPHLFAEVKEELFCKERPLRDVARSLIDRDAIIVMSTFIYKWQIEEYIQAFAQGPLSHKPYKFFIFDFINDINEWNEKREDGSFNLSESFNYLEVNMVYLKRFVKQGRVFSIHEDHDSPETTRDTFWPGCSQLLADPDEVRERSLWGYKKVCYSDENDQFYLEDQDVNK